MVKMGRSERRIRCGKICSLARPCEIDIMRGVAGRRWWGCRFEIEGWRVCAGWYAILCYCPWSAVQGGKTPAYRYE